MKFRPWIPKNTTQPIRFYIEGSTNGAFISKKAGSLKISNSTADEDLKIRSFLLSHQIDIDIIELKELGEKISTKELSVFSMPISLTRVLNVVDFKGL